MDDYYDGDADHNDDDDQEEAENELANLFGRFRSSKYRNRDK